MREEYKSISSPSHTVHPPPNLSAFWFLLGWGRGGVEPPTKFSKTGGLTGPPLLVGVTGKEGSDFFQGGCAFHIKNKLKSEIFDDKKRL